MRKELKRLMTIFTAGVMAASVASLAACNNFKPEAVGATGEVRSNGGFVVEKGDYVYFINGVETYTSDNTYGTPVKGALMQVKKSDIATHSLKNEAPASLKTVIPSLMVDGSWATGICIYGDRIYYATPNNVKNTQGTIENEYLDFKSVKLDGTDMRSYFNVSSNSTPYRFVEDNGTVYVLYVVDSDIYSYNTETKEEVELVRDAGAYVLNKQDVTDPYVYYTMPVSTMIDVEDGAVERPYNQIYRVRASATEAPYKYEYRQEYLDEHDGEAPYLNLGEIVLDGIGSVYAESPTQFTHDLTNGVTPSSPDGFSYNLQSYQNGGIYFTRSSNIKTGTSGEDGWLYYLSAEKLASGWNSISGNDGALEVIAQNTTNASSNALFYLDEQKNHHYLYVNSGIIYRADVTGEDGSAETVCIARGVGSATLVSVDPDSDKSANNYDYLYYTVSGSSGNDIYRLVYNGTEEDYKTLGYEENKPYKPTQVLDIEHARSWYGFEVIDGLLYFADAESVGSNSYNYISVVDLRNADGSFMNNAELAAYKEKYEEVIGEDGYISDLSDDGKSALSTALRYFFFTGERELFDENIKESQDLGKADTYLYNEEDKALFEDYFAGRGDTEKFADHRTRSYFITEIGRKRTEDTDALKDYWKNALERYTEPEEESTGLPGWAWTLIGVGIGVVVVGIGLAVFFVLRAKKREQEIAPAEKRMYVDTTDDRTMDVYSDEPASPEKEENEESEEEPEETPAEETVRESEEREAVSEPEEVPEETSESAETSDEAPAEGEGTDEEKPQ